MKKKTTLLIFVLLIVIMVGVILSFGLSTDGIHPMISISNVLSKTESLEKTILLGVRLPRILSSLLVGGLLAIIGAMIQGVTRNPIAEPSILGVSQGACFFIAISYWMNIGVNLKTSFLASMIGATISGGLVILFIQKKNEGGGITKLLLAGTSMSMMLGAMTSVVGILSNKTQLLGFWINGGFQNTNYNHVGLALIASIVAFIFGVVQSSKINIINLGDEVAMGLGVNAQSTRFKVLIMIIPLVAIAVVVGKTISFVGLIVPQLIRLVIGDDYRKIIPLSFFAGAALLCYSDMFARTLMAPYEIPVGIFTSIIGVPFYLMMAKKEMS